MIHPPPGPACRHPGEQSPVGFAHTGIDPPGLFIGSLLNSVPAALVFVKRDFKSSLGYHFMIDFVRYCAAFFLLIPPPSLR